MKALIYGAGLSGRQVYKNIKDEVQVIGFLDGDPDKKGHVIADDLPCYGGAESLSDMEFDRIPMFEIPGCILMRKHIRIRSFP